MFGLTKKRMLREKLQKVTMDLDLQRIRYKDLLHENVRLTERNVSLATDLASCQRKMNNPPIFREGQIIGGIEILKIDEPRVTDLSIWETAICGIAGIAFFLASTKLVNECLHEKPGYRYKIRSRCDHNEKTVMEAEFCEMVNTQH